MKKNILAVFALAAAASLLSVLPSAAADKPVTPQGRGPVVTQSPLRTGHSSSKGHLNVTHTKSTVPSFMTSAQCSFDCGDFTVTCSGAAVGCTDSSCVALGSDGNGLSAECVDAVDF